MSKLNFKTKFLRKRIKLRSLKKVLNDYVDECDVINGKIVTFKRILKVI